MAKGSAFSLPQLEYCAGNWSQVSEQKKPLKSDGSTRSSFNGVSLGLNDCFIIAARTKGLCMVDESFEPSTLGSQSAGRQALRAGLLLEGAIAANGFSQIPLFVISLRGCY